MEPIADLRPCDHCGYTHPRRMIALMRIWYARFAGLPADGGYFYLCPRCYARLIEPHADEIIHRLVEQHPFLHNHSGFRHYRAEEPGTGASQTGASQPGAKQPGVSQPGVKQPGASQTGVKQPGASQPGASQPGVSQPGARPGPLEPPPAA